MHCIQYIATQAESPEEAHGGVKSYLESLMGESGYESWYDWFITGGGRWASGDDNQYNDDWIGDVAHQSDSRFEEYIEKAHAYYMDELDYTIKQAKEINLEDILAEVDNSKESLYPNFKLTMELYPLHKLWSQMSSSWGPDSYFFDMDNDCTHPKYMRESIDKGNNSWYIVPVDFHF